MLYRESAVEDLFTYLFKGKGNAYLEERLAEKLSRLSDEKFKDAVDDLFRFNNRFGINLNDIESVLEKYLPASRGYVHEAVEVQCDCCGRRYLWSITADKKDSAYKNWWPMCPSCLLEGETQARAHREIKYFGRIPERYLEYLDQNYKHFAGRGFAPAHTQQMMQDEIEGKNTRIDPVKVLKLISGLENSYKERAKKYKLI
jgi:hypothetical protein